MTKNNDNPLVSVVLGTFNGGSTIERALNSILNQTYSNLEIIVCDDASNDNTSSIVSEIAARDSRVKLINNPVNSGLNISLNRCIENSHGEYIARMDDDDISHPDRIKCQLRFIESHPEIALVGCSICYFDESGVWGQSKAIEYPTIKDVFTSHSFAHPTVLMRRDALNAVGNYSTDKLNRRGQDYDLWCKLYDAGFRGANLPQPLFDYYESKESVSRRKLKYRIDHIRKQLKWRRQLNLPASYLFYTIFDVVKCFIPSSIYRELRKRRYK